MSLSWKDLFAMAPQTILVVGGLGILVMQMVLRSGRARVAWQLSVLTLLAAGIVVIFGLSDVSGSLTVLPRAFLGNEVVSAVSGQLRYSAFSGNIILLFIVLALCTVFFMRTIMRSLDLDFAENYFLLLMSVAGYSYAVCAEDLITLFIGVELGSLPLMVLIGINRKDQAANEAALKYLLLSAFAIAFLLFGIALIYAAGGSVKLKEIREISTHFMKTRVLSLAYILVYAGFFFKLAAFPLHSYVADVYEGAPTIFSGLLASFSKVAALFVLLKFHISINDAYRSYLYPVLMVAAAGSMLYGAFASLGTRNIKRLLAYSSISHAGFMLCFFVVSSSVNPGIMGALKQDAGSAVYVYAAGYAFAALLAFGVIALLERASNGMPVTFESLADLYKKDPLAAWALGLSFMSFLGLPPLAGFMGKFFLFKYLAFSDNMPLAAAAGAASAISAYAYLRVLKQIFFSESTGAEHSAKTAYGDAVKIAGGVLLAGICFFAAFSAFLYNTGITAFQKIY